MSDGGAATTAISVFKEQRFSPWSRPTRTTLRSCVNISGIVQWFHNTPGVIGIAVDRAKRVTTTHTVLTWAVLNYSHDYTCIAVGSAKLVHNDFCVDAKLRTSTVLLRTEPSYSQYYYCIVLDSAELYSPLLLYCCRQGQTSHDVHSHAPF